LLFVRGPKLNFYKKAGLKVVFTLLYPTGLETIPIGKSIGIPLENVPKFRVHNLTP
jgi:hypothetical protein